MTYAADVLQAGLRPRYHDYRRAPVPPLHGSDAEWVAVWLQQRGKR
jgi:hypothetical protein